MKNFKKDIKLYTERFSLVALKPHQVELVYNYVTNNINHHKHAMPHRNKAFFSFELQKLILEEENELQKSLKMIRFYIFDKHKNNILGDIIINDIQRGYVASASIGVKIDKDSTRKGIAEECCKEVLSFIFNGLEIYRIEANILPKNIPSIKLFEKLGFTKEGISRGYFYTDGDWQDHLRYSLLKTD
ncbi:GNAT family protein [Candidatus Kapabacteria bacterium]|nr:GNAT family protein [Candidatus Kapabacteria bacterium]